MPSPLAVLYYPLFKALRMPFSKKNDNKREKCKYPLTTETYRRGKRLGMIFLPRDVLQRARY
jgi:hypothetical protein